MGIGRNGFVRFSMMRGVAARCAPEYFVRSATNGWLHDRNDHFYALGVKTKTFFVSLPPFPPSYTAKGRRRWEIKALLLFYGKRRGEGDFTILPLFCFLSRPLMNTCSFVLWKRGGEGRKGTVKNRARPRVRGRRRK